MMKFLDKMFDGKHKDGFDSIALLLMRLAFGGAMLTHGWPKLMSWGERSSSFPDPLGLGSPAFSLFLVVFAEVICAALIVLGFLTRLASIPLIITMAVAFFVVHAADPFGEKELAFLFLSGYLVILLRGAGHFSIDSLFRK